MSVRVRYARKERLARKLHALAPQAERELTEAALKGAREVVDAAKKFVPVRDGVLRDSGAGVLLPETAQRQRVVAAAVFRAPHAHLVEFGTAERFHKSGKSVGSAPAQPFLFPAYRIMKRRIKGRMSRAITKSLKAVARA
ncbi:MAG: HK97 gp10 family phage protein [Alphaproteobacteria bacterium]|nr:MAG: HK97 gp10 family phage protein [Alphaproteobacteria bacterium]